MKPRFIACLFAICFGLVLVLPGYGAEDAKDAPLEKLPGRDAPLWDKGEPQEMAGFPLIRKITPGVLQIGNIIVDKPSGFVSAEGTVNMDEGLVEYLACGPRGKLHESVLNLNVSPYHLQIALLLIGLEPGNKPLEFQGAPGIPEGDPVEIWVSWQGRGRKTVRFRAEDLVFNKAAGKPMKQTHWIFTGSQVMDGRFMAEVEHSIVATYHDPFAILDHPLATGGDDTLYFVNTKVVPRKGTPVTFEIKSLKQ